jgi:hypothetical protein
MMGVAVFTRSREGAKTNKKLKALCAWEQGLDRCRFFLALSLASRLRVEKAQNKFRGGWR